MTDKIENTNAKVATTSDLSDFVGPSVDVSDPSVTIIRNMNDLVEPDVFDWTKRLFSLDEMRNFSDGIPIGPTGTDNTGITDMLDFFRSISILNIPLTKYFGLSYESIEIRVSVSDPKNLVGGIWVGWWPYVDWYDKNPEETFTAITDSEFLQQGFVNGPYTHHMLFGMSQDVAFTIPWSFKTPFIETAMIQALDSSSPDQRPIYGTPCFWWAMSYGTTYVTSVMNPAAMRVFVKFNNLKFYGPTSNVYDPSPLDNHSGLEVVAGAEIATAVASTLGADALMSKVTDMFVGPQETEEIASFGTYDEPQAVQMAFIGDTSSCGYPQTTPIFSPHLNPESVKTPSVHDFLSRPQFIGWFTSATSGFTIHNNNPMRFHDTAGADGNSTANYFRFFGLLNRYWRGTILYHYVIAGHPLIQTQFTAIVSYGKYAIFDSTNQLSTEFCRHLSTFPGSKQIVVPLPYLSTADYMPVQDAYPYDAAPTNAWTTQVRAKLRIVSTMLDIAPTIPVYIYVSAGSDFAYYAPIPPGIYNAALNDAKAVYAAQKVAQSNGETPVPVVPSKSRSPPRLGGPPGPASALSTSRKTKSSNGASVALGGHKQKLDTHVFLPMDDQKEVANTRFQITSDPGTHISLPFLTDYMKIWSRSVPFGDYDNDENEEPIPDAGVGLKSASWYPPIDRTADLDSNNSWFFTLDYIAYLSSMYVYYKGEMGYKVVCSTSSTMRIQEGYVYVALGDPVTRQMTHVPFEYDTSQMPPQSNFGTGTVVTPTSKQPVLDFTLPYRGSNVWSYVCNNAYLRPPAIAFELTENADVQHNIVLLWGTILTDAFFRKIGPNFALGVEQGLPPPTMWVARGFDWSS